MPTLQVTSNTTAQTVAAERRDAVARPTSINIDNSGGAADRTIRLQDIFTPSVTNGDSSPSQQTLERWRTIVLQGETLHVDESELKGLRFLGALSVIGDAIDAGCYVSVNYEHTKG